MSYKIAISNIALANKIPQGDKRWGVFNDSFENLDLDDPIDIANAIYTGRSFTTWHNGRRCLDNFVLGQHIAVDMDSGDARSSIDTLLANNFVQMYASMIYTTPSHTEATPRARVLFLLDQTITDANAYQQAAKFLCTLFDGADTACTDASRFFYGSLNCHIALINRTLPLSHLRTYYRRNGSTVPSSQKTVVQPVTTTEVLPQPQNKTEKHVEPKKLLEWAVNDAATQGRNTRAYRLGKQLKEGGYTYSEALPIIQAFQQNVDRIKSEPFPLSEATKTLDSAYKH